MPRESFNHARLEAFSDGVIAVIITIMVLELKVPSLDGVDGVRTVLPTLILYLLSFVQVGLYWVNHHYLIEEAGPISHTTLWANLIFLFSLSLFPFVTDWIGQKHLSSFSTALYAAVSLLPGCSYTALWLTIRKHSFAPPHASWAKLVSSITLYLLAIPAAYVRPSFALVLIAIVSVLWIMPPSREAIRSNEAQASDDSSPQPATSHRDRR